MGEDPLIARTLALAAAVVAVLGLSACGTPSPGQSARAECARDEGACIEVGVGRPIYIGTLLFETDSGGIDAKRSLAMAVDYLDGQFDTIDGQLLGHPVVTLPETEDCTPKGGIDGAKRLLLEPDLVAVIGTTCSAASFDAAAKVLSEKSVLMISPSNTSPSLTDPGLRERYYFRTAANDLIQGAAVASFARDRLKARTAGVISVPDAYSRVLGDAFATRFEALGGRADARGSMSLRGSAAGAVAKVAAARPDVVFLPLIEPACTRAVKAIRDTPALAATKIVVSESCQTPKLSRALGAAANGVYASGPDAKAGSRDGFYTGLFLPAYRDRFGGAPPSVFHATGFDAANLLFGAIRRASVRLPGGALIIDRAKVRSAMLDVEGYQGLSGVLTCRPTGDCAQGARIAVYRSPAWPQLSAGAKPVFSQTLTLAEVTGQG